LKDTSNWVQHNPVKMLKADGKADRGDCYRCKKELGKRKATPFKCESCDKRFCIDGVQKNIILIFKDTYACVEKSWNSLRLFDKQFSFRRHCQKIHPRASKPRHCVVVLIKR